MIYQDADTKHGSGNIKTSNLSVKTKNLFSIPDLHVVSCNLVFVEKSNSTIILRMLEGKMSWFNE